MSLSHQDLVRLNSAHIDTLSKCARAAGLSWKSGTLHKAGIIARLSQFPAIGRATLSALDRESPREGRPVPFVEPNRKPAPMDWSDEDTPTPPKAEQAAPIPLVDLAPLWLAIQSKADRATVETLSKALADGVSRLSARCAELEKRAPISIPMGEGKPVFTFGDELTHPKLPDVLRILRAGEQVYLHGPASSGKTTAARQVRSYLAKHFDRENYSLEVSGAVADGFALTGYKNAQGEYIATAFRRAVEFGHLFLFDEIDASAREALLVINMLDNGVMSFPDATIPVHPHFRLICGGNTDGSGATMQYSGRERLDGAFLDRFAIIDWQIDSRIETSLAQGETQWLAAVHAIRAFAKAREITDVIATARATRRGPKFLQQGMSREDILSTTCKRGALSECWPDVLNLPAVRAFLSGV